MPTLKEVASKAGVSTATVSKVLSHTPYVSEETRRRVLQAIDELGYVPNLAARALSKGRTYIVGVIFPYNYDHLFSDPFIVRMVEGIEVICSERGYNVLISTPRAPVSESEQFQRLVRSGYLDGAISIETLPGKPASELLEESGYVWVAIGYHSGSGTLNTIHPDDRAGARAAATYLLSLGHRHIGVIAAEKSTLVAAEIRVAGYSSAFADLALDFEAMPRINASYSMESGYDAAGRLLGKSPRPTAFLCLNDRMAMGAIQRIRAEGLRVPEEISVVGFDDIPGAAFFDPPLTTVRQPAYEMGKKAAQMLFKKMEAKLVDRYGSRHDFEAIVFPTELIIRGTVKAPG